METEIITAEAVVLGAGAGGFGAVYRLIKNGIKTVVVDKNTDFGGTAVFAGVSCWEPGISKYGVNNLLVEEMKKRPLACGVGLYIPNTNIYRLGTNEAVDYEYTEDTQKFPELPWGLSVSNCVCDYKETLGRCIAFIRKHGLMKRFQFEETEMTRAMNSLLNPYKQSLTTFFESEYMCSKTSGDKILSITIKKDDKLYEIQANHFIDCSGDIVLAVDSGCEVMLGSEDKSSFNEPSATVADPDNLNGVTQLFRITKVDDNEYIDEIPQKYLQYDINEWKENYLYKNRVISCYNVYPNGGININMLPTITGGEYLKFGDKAKDIAMARMYAYWNHMQTKMGLNGYKIIKTYDLLGVREGPRLRGKYILTENDCKNGFKVQQRKAEFIAFADHALDVHGDKKIHMELEIPYGIPFSCLQPNEYTNLLVACRGSSFSHIAGSSCRHTRTMTSIGEAAGEAVAQMIGENRAEVDIEKLRQTLGIPEYEQYLESAF